MRGIMQISERVIYLLPWCKVPLLTVLKVLRPNTWKSKSRKSKTQKTWTLKILVLTAIFSPFKKGTKIQ